MESLIMLILGSELYNILLQDRPEFLAVITILFTLIIILMFFKLCGSLVHIW